MSVSLFWATRYPEKIQRGNAYGYAVHNESLFNHCRLLGMRVDDPEAEDYLHIISPPEYRPFPNKRNWLFTMFESADIPPEYLDPVKKADYVLAPSKWVADVYRFHLPGKPIFVVPHGVEPVFHYIKRKDPRSRGQRFRFLWVGAPNIRKGWEEIVYIWARAGFADRDDVELYLKTTMLDRVERRGNVVLDGRKIPRKDLIRLYHRSHCFLFPTRGEGFGLTLAEAMRTGLPCIAPHYSGVTEFFDDTVGFVVPYSVIGSRIVISDGVERDIKVILPDMYEIAKRMLWILDNYDEALVVGKRAAERMKNEFTWERSARTLMSVVLVEKKKREGKDISFGESDAVHAVA